MERRPQTQQYKKDEEAEKYPEGKGTGQMSTKHKKKR